MSFIQEVHNKGEPALTPKTCYLSSKPRTFLSYGVGTSFLCFGLKATTDLTKNLKPIPRVVGTVFGLMVFSNSAALITSKVYKATANHKFEGVIPASDLIDRYGHPSFPQV